MENTNPNDYLAQLMARTEKKLNVDAPVSAVDVNPSVADAPEDKSSTAGDDLWRQETFIFTAPGKKEPSPAEKDDESWKKETFIFTAPGKKETEPEEDSSTEASNVKDISAEASDTSWKKDTYVFTVPETEKKSAEAPAEDPYSEHVERGVNSLYVPSFTEQEVRRNTRAEKKRLKQSRRALMDKESGKREGLFRGLFGFIWFMLVVLVTIFVVLYLLQLIADVEIINLTEIWNYVKDLAESIFP